MINKYLEWFSESILTVVLQALFSIFTQNNPKTVNPEKLTFLTLNLAYQFSLFLKFFLVLKRKSLNKNLLQTVIYTNEEDDDISCRVPINLHHISPINTRQQLFN